jgi:hypothetical protein
VFERMKPTSPGAPRARRRALLPAVLVLASILALAASWIDPTAVCALPALVLALVMALRPYPGERVLERLRRAPSVRRRHPSASSPAVARCELVPPRGGLLLARALAVRPPPGALLATA